MGSQLAARAGLEVSPAPRCGVFPTALGPCDMSWRNETKPSVAGTLKLGSTRAAWCAAAKKPAGVKPRAAARVGHRQKVDGGQMVTAGARASRAQLAMTGSECRTVTAAAGRMIASEARSRSTARDEAQSQRERQWLPTTHGRVASHAACGLCCVITPILVVGRRNYVRWREGQRDIIRRRSSAMAYNRTRQQQQSSGEISPSHSPGGPVGAPKGGGRRGSRLMGVEVAPEGGLALSGRVLP